MQQPIRPMKGPLHAKVIIPGSKSITHRAMILAALSDGVSEISGMRISQSTRIFARALHQLGIVTQLDEKTRSCIIAGGTGNFPKKQATVWCAGSRTIAKFLLAACSATPGVFYFDGSTSLRRQPIAQLLNILCRQGAQLIPSDASKLPFTLIGSDTLEGGEINLSNHTYAQLISALMMIAPYARSPLNFMTNASINQPSIDITCAMMAEFGVLVHRIHHGQFMVPVPQRYQAKDYTVEPDYSIAAYFFAAAAVTGGEVTIQPAKSTQSKQPDVKFLSVLEKMGCRIHESHAGLSVHAPTELHGLEISMRAFSDTFLALSVIAPFARSPVRIAHIGAINKKEANRMMAVKIELIKLGIHVETGEDWIKIFPSTPKPAAINSHHDPRIAMAFSIIGLKIPGIIINDAECVKRIFTDFFTQWDKMTEHSNINA